jgi:hypothetical protein
MNGAPPPRVPRPGSRRGREHAQQRNDVNTDGYFVERFFSFPFGNLAPGASQEVNLRIMSMGSRYIVCPAIRGSLAFSNRTTLNGFELASLQLRLVLNALDDWISDGEGGNTASLGLLFARQPSPWFWFAHPHRLRAGDNLIATLTNTSSGETAPTLRAELVLRLMDADIYWDLYGKLVDIAEATDHDLLNEEVG